MAYRDRNQAIAFIYENPLKLLKAFETQEKTRTFAVGLHNYQQKQAIELAIKNGYYNVPRKTSVEKLAKLSKLSFSTFQVHLRKAEEKLIPYFFEA